MQQFRRLEKLEAIRGLAAFYVLVHHFVHMNEELKAMRKFFIFGQLAVLVFFVLSGFVIYYASIARKPNMRFRDFFIRRFRRIYPPFLLALGLGYIVKSYAAGYAIYPQWEELVGNLFMLQDKNLAGSWFYPYLGNSPLWSLSYEWWFYMMFFGLHLALRKRPEIQKYVVFVAALVGFATFQLMPNQISLYVGYFILWWSGLEIAKEYLETNRVTWKGQSFTIAGVGVAAILWGIPAYLDFQVHGTLHLSGHPILEFRHFSSIFLVLFFGIGWHKLGFIGFNKTLGIFSRIAPISYALYIFHLPIIGLGAHMKWTGSPWLDLIWMLPIIFGLSWVVEQPLQKWINSWMK